MFHVNMTPQIIRFVLVVLLIPCCLKASDPWGTDSWEAGSSQSENNKKNELYKPKLYGSKDGSKSVYDPATGAQKTKSSSIKNREDSKKEEEMRKKFYQQEREQLIRSYQGFRFGEILKSLSTDLGIFRETCDRHGSIPEEKLEQCKKSAILVRKLQKQEADVQNLIKSDANCDKLYSVMKPIENGVERAKMQNKELKLYFQQIGQELKEEEQRQKEEESLKLRIHYAQNHVLCNNESRTCKSIWLQPWGKEWYISFLDINNQNNIYLVASESEIQEFAPKTFNTILKKLNRTLQYLQSHNLQDLKKTSLFVWNVKCVVFTPPKGHIETRTDKVIRSNKNRDTQKSDAKDQETGKNFSHEDIDEKTIETETKYCYEVYVVDQKASNDIQIGLNFNVSCNGGLFSFWIETPHGHKLFEKEAPLFGKDSEPLSFENMTLIRNDPVAMLTALSMLPEMVGEFVKADSSQADLEDFLNQD